jgi:probable addiction module antidote protein
MTIETSPFDAAKYLDTPESQAELIDDAIETGDAKYLANALGVVARAKGMSAVAQDTGVTREGLYKALSADGDPKLSTFMAVIRSLGLQLSVRPIAPAAEKDDDGDLRHAS